MEILEYIALTILAFIPSVFWVLFFCQYDWQRPEPPALITRLFIWGILIAFPAIFLERGFAYFLSQYFDPKTFLFIVLKIFLGVALIEEALKYSVVKIKVYNHFEFDEPIDGIIYCVTVALGFAALENIAAIILGGPTSVFSRFATTTLMHALAGGILGYFIGLAKFRPKREKLFLIQGLGAAIIFHGVFNLIVNFHSKIAFIVLIIALMIMFFLVFKAIKRIKKLA